MSNTPSSVSAADRLLGGRYVLGDLVGRGAMAEVYRAYDRRLERPVAVKIFSANSDPMARSRFEAEAYVLARLAHPGLALIFDVGTLADRPFLVMEFIDGEDLRTRLVSGPMPQEDVVRIGATLADALAHAHSRGVVHRDVKPANIMLDHDGCPHLTDFGIAMLSGAPRLTSTNAIIGTPAYLAPEQLVGEHTGPPADVYALGLVMLECLTGEVEYPAGSNLASALTRLSRPPRIPAGLPSALAGLLTAMTAAEPATRPTAGECARLLLASVGEPSTGIIDAPPAITAVAAEPVAWWADENRTLAAPAVSPRPAAGPARRGWRSLTAAGVGVAAVAVALGLLLNLQPSPPSRVPTGSSLVPATSQPVSGGSAGRTGPGGGRVGAGPPAGTLVANEHSPLTVVTSSSQPSAAVPSSSAPQPPVQPSTVTTPSSSLPSSTTDAPATSSSGAPTTTSDASGNGTG